MQKIADLSHEVVYEVCRSFITDEFPDGFHGTMGELLCAIEEGREPSHSARNNLRSLALCYAAVASAETGQPVEPGRVQGMPES